MPVPDRKPVGELLYETYLGKSKERDLTDCDIFVMIHLRAGDLPSRPNVVSVTKDMRMRTTSIKQKVLWQGTAAHFVLLAELFCDEALRALAAEIQITGDR